MADLYRISPCGGYLTTFDDSTSGSTTDGNATLTGDIFDLDFTASGGHLQVTHLCDPQKFPFCVGNQFKAIYKLSRHVHVGETVTVDVPTLYSDGAVSNTTGVKSVTNESYYCDNITEIVEAGSGDSVELYYLDPDNGDDTAAAAAHPYSTSTIDDVQSPGTVAAYATFAALWEDLRGTSNVNTFVTKEACVLIKGGTTVDGEVETTFTSGFPQSTGGVAVDQPLCLGVYDSSGGSVDFAARTTSGGTMSRVFQPAGASKYLFVGRGIRFIGNSFSTQAVRFAAAAGETRSNYLLLGVEFIQASLEFSFFSAAGFTQTSTGICQCVFDGEDTFSGNGGCLHGAGQFDEFCWREVFLTECVIRNIGDNDQFHGVYLKDHIDFISHNNWFYEVSGTVHKMDNCWGYDIRWNNLIRVSSVANTETNGAESAGYPADRTRDVVTDEKPTGGYAGGLGIGGYGKFGTVADNTLTNPLATTERGSGVTGLLSEAGPHYDCNVENNLAVLSSNNQVVGINYGRDAGSSNGWFRDSDSNVAARNTIAVIGTRGNLQTHGWSYAGADTDTFDANDNDQCGHHNITASNNIIYFNQTTTAGDVTLARHGTSPGDDDYDTTHTAGRGDYDLLYNNFYDANGMTGKFQNGADTDSFDSISTFQTDLNSGSDTPATGNRSEDPGFSDDSYEFSDYLVAGLGYSDLDDAINAVQANALSITKSETLDVVRVANNVRSRWLPASLSTSNYNSEQIGAGLVDDGPYAVGYLPAVGASTSSPVFRVTFSEIVKVNNGSAVIEVRRVSDDTLIDSITASAVSINIDDRSMVTLTGLDIGGALGAMYINIPGGAFAAPSTDLPSDPVSGSTQWYFTAASPGASRLSVHHLMYTAAVRRRRR